MAAPIRMRGGKSTSGTSRSTVKQGSESAESTSSVWMGGLPKDSSSVEVVNVSQELLNEGAEKKPVWFDTKTLMLPEERQYDEPLNILLAFGDSGLVYDKNFCRELGGGARTRILDAISSLPVAHFRYNKREYWTSAFLNPESGGISALTEHFPESTPVPTAYIDGQLNTVSNLVLDRLNTQINSNSGVWGKPHDLRRDLVLKYAAINYYPYNPDSGALSDGGYRDNVAETKDDWDVVAILSFGLSRFFKIKRPSPLPAEDALPSFIMSDGALLALVGNSVHSNYTYTFKKFDTSTDVVGSWMTLTLRYKFRVSLGERYPFTSGYSRYIPRTERGTQSEELIEASKKDPSYWKKRYAESYIYQARDNNGTLVTERAYPAFGKKTASSSSSSSTPSMTWSVHTIDLEPKRLLQKPTLQTTTTLSPLAPTSSLSSTQTESTSTPKRTSSGRGQSKKGELEQLGRDAYEVDRVLYSIDQGNC